MVADLEAKRRKTMKHTFTQAQLQRLTSAELRTLFRMVANLAAQMPEGSPERSRCFGALRTIARECSRRQAPGPKPSRA